MVLPPAVFSICGPFCGRSEAFFGAFPELANARVTVFFESATRASSAAPPDAPV
jgi:hypothetical protein